MAKKPKVPVYDRLPNAYEHANRTVYLPPSKALGSFRDLNREEPGFWGSDGERWHLLAAEEQLPVTVPPPTDGTTFITNINNVKITHGHRWRIFDGDTITAKDYYQYIIVDNIIVDEGAEIIVEEFGDFIVLGDRFGEGAAADVEVKVGNTLFVDEEYGVTGERENFIVPYPSGTAAEADAVSGDTIVFRAGVHTISASLGKDGVTYYNSPGSVLRPVSNLFDDDGSAMTIRFVNDGVVETNGISICDMSNASSAFYMNGNGGTQTGVGSNIMFRNRGAKLYLSLNSSIQTVNGSAFIYQSVVTSYTRCQVNNVETTKHIGILENDSGELDITWNTAYSRGASGDSGSAALRTSNGDSIIRAKSNYWKADAAVGVYSAIQPNGGKIYFEGIIEYDNSSTGWVDVANMVGSGSNAELHLRNARLVNKSTTGSNSSSVIRMDEDITNRLIIENSKLINESPLATGHGINVYQQLTPAPTEEVISIQDTVILLNSTGVGLGAKAIRKISGTLFYKALTDIFSNGTYDGTNLVGVTSALTDAEIKSD